ncbi:MAG: hypothetical protein PF481_00295 [Bacteroidales bacterium]|jgi:hypothetical protein|nr:hypothetical protein [Bacteroidales bacterium]
MKIIPLLLITVLISVSCKKKCPDNLSEYNKKIPYHDRDLIPFHNDTLGLKYDTIYLDLTDMNDEKYNPFLEGEDVCYGASKVNYSNKFNYFILQHANYNVNHVDYSTRLYNFDMKFITYIFNQDTINARHYYLDVAYVDSVYGIEYTYEYMNEARSFYYNHFIFMGDDNPEYKLLEYSTVDTSGIRRRWVLQE